MNELPFGELSLALKQPGFNGEAGSRLRVAVAPSPFVPPELVWEGDTVNPFAAEVLYVVAPAAVGKSTLARQLSATRQIPLLNLAEVPVSTGSLKALISDLKGPGDALSAFHAGELPVIVDALDEGRLLSGETGFESFLQTAGELLLQNRRCTNRPKLVFLGRHESIADADLGLQLAGEGIVTRRFGVGSFGEDSARQLIDAYARAGCSPEAAYLSNPKPVASLVTAYFLAIESALGLERGSLWSSERGRMFAGYAPVLAALGSLLAKIDNFLQVTTRLQTEGATEAWAVIETVLGEILTRERGKFCDQLAKRISSAVPPEAYDAEEQLDLLVAHIHRVPASASARVRLSPKDAQTYVAMAEQMVTDHPFVRQREPSNAVLGSVILAHAIRRNLLKNQKSRFLPDLSRQPFLWRSLSSVEFGHQNAVDGGLVGFVLNSYWNDAVQADRHVTIRSTAEDDNVSVEFRRGGDEGRVLHAVAPLTFFAQVRECDVDVAGSLRLVGQGGAEAASVFMLHGGAKLLCEIVEVAADALVLEGDVWIEAEEAIASPTLRLYPKDSCRVGWGGHIATQFPWNRIPSTLPSPHGNAQGDVIARLVEECQRRLPAIGVLTLTPGFGVPDDARMRWVARDFSSAFRVFMEAMLDAGLIKVDEAMSAHGERKIRVHFNVAWGEILRSVREPACNPKLQDVLIKARNALSDNGQVMSSVRAPRVGETRYYKKISDTGSYDVMIRVDDCGCNKWQGAHKADKAKKGVAKLENGRTDWKSIQHCASCTGGGMWKVRW